MENRFLELVLMYRQACLIEKSEKEIREKIISLIKKRCGNEEWYGELKANGIAAELDEIRDCRKRLHGAVLGAVSAYGCIETGLKKMKAARRGIGNENN